MADKSLDALLSFLDWTADKGLMAKNTVGGRKAAVNSVLGVLDPEEKGDVTAVDLETAMTRFINLQGKKYNTSSLNVYKSRTNAAIKDFAAWLNNPLSFKPQNNKLENLIQKSTKLSKPANSREHPSEPQSAGNISTSPQASANVFPIPIRENVVVRIHGLPFDLTPQEARKISNVVLAMAPNDF